MRKLKIQIVVAFTLFLAVILGGSLIYYSFFAEKHLILQKKRAIDSAFSLIRSLDLNNIPSEDDEVFLPLEEASYSLLLCDQNFRPLYFSKTKGSDTLIQERVKDQIVLYSPDARAVFHKEETGSPISLYGLISQKGTDFYVYIYENTRIMHFGISYAARFLWKIFIILLILGPLFAFVFSARISKTLGQIQQMITRISRNDFSMRLPTVGNKNELACLASDINLMADKIQRDINDLNNYNYLLLKQNRDMAEFEDMRKKLVSNITHELKTPLAIISSQVELLQYEYDDTKKDYYFSSILEETDKMSRLISSILQNSRLENHIQNAALRWENLSDLLLELVPKYENWLSSLKIQFSTSIEEDCQAYIDSLQIEQAINNYMMNASRHT